MAEQRRWVRIRRFGIAGAFNLGLLISIPPFVYMAVVYGSLIVRTVSAGVFNARGLLPNPEGLGLIINGLILLFGPPLAVVALALIYNVLALFLGGVSFMVVEDSPTQNP